jgi:type I restriction enzyme S subunit
MTYPAYPKYRDSGIEWLGEIPEGWDLLPLFTVLQERKEKNIGGKEDNVLSLSYGSIIRRNVEDNSGLLPESFETYQIVYPGNIILRLTDLQNDKRSLRTGLVKERGIITSAYVCLESTIKYQIDSNFSNYLLHSYDISKVFYSLGGGVRQSMKYVDLKWLQIPIPRTEEQQSIASFLDKETEKIDTLISKKERQIELLQEKRSALISHAVTKGLNPDVKMKDSGIEWLGEIPEGWELKRLKYIASINDEALGENTKPDYELLYVDISSIDSAKGIINIEPMLFEKAPSRARRIVCEGDVIVSTVRTYLRAIAPITNAAPNLIVSTGFAVVRPKLGFNSAYAAYALRATYFVDSVVSRSVGVSYPAINASEIGTLAVALPPHSEQKVIASFLDKETKKIDTLIDKIKFSIEKLREYRTALISATVTGKIDVRKEVA